MPQTSDDRTYAVASWLFLRLLGFTYLAAFSSAAVQIPGLVGHDGILPAHSFMERAGEFFGDGPGRFAVLPTLAWISASDAALRGLSVAGCASAILLVLGVLPGVMLPLLWLGYLSLSVVCREFLSFQWDALLLEAGLLAVWLAPWTARDRWSDRSDPPRAAIWMLLWLTFRLMFASGAVKLASGDRTWWDLTALTYHFWTQPIPTPIGWYAAHLPVPILKASTAAMFVIECAAPFSIFGSPWIRAIGFALLVGLQAAIALTGNYAFFNLLSAALCLFLLDDRLFERLLRLKSLSVRRYPEGRPRRLASMAFALATVPVSLFLFTGSIGIRLPGWPLVAPVVEAIAPFRSVNTYGLFAVMTTARPEIVVEGSDDAMNWSAYEFKYKPTSVDRRPPWVAPHQPRLDWQMWFAALSRYEEEAWFHDFSVRLLQGSPDVLRLLWADPFRGRPPRYVRSSLYQYRFATAGEHAASGVWWTRERAGPYSPVLSLTAEGRPSSADPSLR